MRSEPAKETAIIKTVNVSRITCFVILRAIVEKLSKLMKNNFVYYNNKCTIVTISENTILQILFLRLYL